MKPLNLINKLRSLSRLILPPAEIGGLQVSNTSIRFMVLKRGSNGDLSAKSASLRLPPGIIDEGRVKDKPNFVEALRSLHAQITPKGNETINVVLTIPAGDVYVETFNLPALEDKSVEEAADLNMQMISPNPIEKSYYSWMVVGNPSKGENQIEILGAFAVKDAVDELTSSVEEAGFAIAAIEFSSLSLKRLLTELGAVRPGPPYMLLKLTQEGLIFMIIRNGNLYFNYFYSWGKIEQESGAITLEKALAIVGSETQRVLNFHSSHYGGQISDIILITSVFTDEIASFLKFRYPSSEVTILKSDKDNLHGVRGAALRGLVERRNDLEIDLLSHDTINAFWRDRVIRFADLWRNLALTTSLFLLLVFGLSWYFVENQAEVVKAANATNLRQAETSELIVLQNEAKRFNSLVSALAKTKVGEISLPSIIEKIGVAAGSNVSINKLSLRSTDLSGLLNGAAPFQDLIFAFKNRLLAVPELSAVDLPLSSITSQSGGSWTFVVTFKIAP